jgi:hypothetical protein
MSKNQRKHGIVKRSSPAWQTPAEVPEEAPPKKNLAVYHRFVVKDLPDGVKPWPEEIREPVFAGDMPDVPELANGIYYNCWSNGQLRLVVIVYKGQVVEWLRLGNGTADGCWKARWKGNAVAAEKYYSSGKMEDFNPWSDSDPDYPATISFGKWARAYLKRMAEFYANRESEDK